MGALDDAAADVAGAGGAGNDVDRAREVVGVADAQEGECFFECADDGGALYGDEVRLGEEGKARWIVWAGCEEERARFGDAGRGAGER
jgi:hypothetical protein